MGETVLRSADVRQRDLRLGTVRAWSMDFAPMTLRQPGASPEAYNVCLLLRGAMARVLDENEAAYNPYDLQVIDCSQPFELRSHSDRGLVSCVGVEVPKNLLPPLGDRATRVVGPPISGREGIGALLAGFLTRLTADTASYQPADGARLGVVATDLVSALLAHTAEEDDPHLPPDVHRRTLLMRIKAFVRRHLHDPHLNPGVIAAAHHVSVSYLHRLFQAEGVSVAAWIRQRRLEHARRDLADPALHAVPVHDIAARWGFIHHAAFTRAFRAAYGIPPRDYRVDATSDIRGLSAGSGQG